MNPHVLGPLRRDRACSALLLLVGAACRAPAEGTRPLAQPGAEGFDATRLERVVAGTFYWSGAATTHFFADPREDLVGLVVCQELFEENQLFPRFRTAVYQALE